MWQPVSFCSIDVCKLPGMFQWSSAVEELIDVAGETAIEAEMAYSRP